MKEGTENTDAVKALKAALESQQVVDYINEKYDGSVVSVVTDPTDGYDASVNYDALNGTTISVAASPHAPRRNSGGRKADPGSQGRDAGHSGLQRLCGTQYRGG